MLVSISRALRKKKKNRAYSPPLPHASLYSVGGCATIVKCRPSFSHGLFFLFTLLYLYFCEFLLVIMIIECVSVTSDLQLIFIYFPYWSDLSLFWPYELEAEAATVLLSTTTTSTTCAMI